MTKQDENNARVLILMRHAKSDWADDSLSDHDRPLNERGREAAPAMADWLHQLGFVPDVILSSSSVRTCQTVRLMTEQWPQEPQVLISDSLYLATPSTILRVAREDAGDAQRLMIVAHNPGMAYVVSGLSEQHMDMPTAAVAVFRFDENVDWCDLQPRTPMSLVHFMRPKSL